MDVKSNRERADRRMNWIEFRAREVIFLNCAPHRNAIEVYRWFRAIAVSQQRCDVSYNRNVYYNTHANCFALLISSTTNSLTLFLSLSPPSLSRSCVGAPILLFYLFCFCCKNIENTDTAIVLVSAHTIPLNLPDLVAAAAAAAAKARSGCESERASEWEGERVKEKKQPERRQAFIISHCLRQTRLGVFFLFFCFLRIIYTGQLQCILSI